MGAIQTEPTPHAGGQPENQNENRTKFSHKFAYIAVNQDKSPKCNWSDPKNHRNTSDGMQCAGLICGKVSDNLEVIDVDNHFFDGEFLLSEIASNFSLDSFPIVSTQSGGFHILYRCEQIGRNQKLANRMNAAGKPEVLIETRGEGGYIATIPTPGYTFVQGTFETIPEITIEQRADLIAVCKGLNEYHRDTKVTHTGNSTERPGDLFNQSHEGIERAKNSLTRAGWKTDEGTYWTRPDKKTGVSATFGKVAAGWLYVFSSNAYPFESGRAYNPFQIMVLLDYDGNFKACAKDLSEKYIKTQTLPTRKDKQPSQPIVSSVFPVDSFPVEIQKIIKATNECLNFPVDFFGASLLFAASLAVGNTHKVEVMSGWLEGAVLYIAIVGRPGANKSSPLSAAVQPIAEFDKMAYRQYEVKKALFEQNEKLSKKERENLGITEMQKPIWNKFLLSDTTPEALASVHMSNKRGIGLCVDELAGWFKNFNKYNKGSEVEFWLSGWSGKPINIDRKTSDPIYIPMPFISVAGTIQNGLLAELAKDNRGQNGFIDRILFVIPENIQKSYWSTKEINPNILQSWNEILSSLLRLSTTFDSSMNPEPKVLQFSPEAKRVLIEWQKANTDEANEANELISGIYSKLEIYVIRLALILELLHFVCGEANCQNIGIDAINGAIKLVEYFKISAIKVNSIITNSSPIVSQPLDKQELYKQLPETFTTDQGVQIAKSAGVAERTFKRFLNDMELFDRSSRGEYKKHNSLCQMP